jgi:hypothetical protein
LLDLQYNVLFTHLSEANISSATATSTTTTTTTTTTAVGTTDKVYNRPAQMLSF